MPMNSFSEKPLAVVVAATLVTATPVPADACTRALYHLPRMAR